MSIIHLCIPKEYLFNGISFEMTFSGPWPLKKDGDPKERCGLTFYRSIREWIKMKDDEREKFRVGGGCLFLDTEAKA